MRRRRFLAALPAVTAFAGCTAGSGSGTRSPSGTPIPGESTVEAKLTSAYRYVVNVDGIDVRPPERDQFAFVRPPALDGTPRPTGGGSGPEVPPGTPAGAPPDAFELALDEGRFAPVDLDVDPGPLMPGIGGVYVEETRRGWFAFDVPAVDTEQAALVHDGVRYPLADEVRERLAAAPDFRLESVSVPDAIGPDEEIELGVTVTNEGDREGVFLAGFRHSGMPRAVNVRAETGETASETVRYEALYESGTMTFDFDHAGGDENYEVTIRSATETGPA